MTRARIGTAADAASGELLVPTRLARIGAATGRHPGPFVVAWVILVVAAFALAFGAVTGESLFDRLHSGAPETEGEARTGLSILDERSPTGESIMLQVSDAPAVDAALSRARAATARLADVDGVETVQSPLLLPDGLTDSASAPLLADGTPTSRGFVTVVALSPGLDPAATSAAEQQVRAGLDEIVAALPGAQGQVGSVNLLVHAVTSQVEKDLRAGEGIALPLSFVVMFFVFGGFVAAGLPIAGAVASIAGALAALFGFSHLLDLDATVVNVVTLLGLGLAIDYGLLTVSRFREELGIIAARDLDHRRHLPTGDDIAEATSRTVATAGRTVLFSGLTVAIAISGLLIFDAQVLRAIGAAGVSVVLVAVVVDLTLLPALCALGARRLARSPRARGSGETSDQGAFSRLAAFVQRGPIRVIAATVIVLVALSLPLFGMRLTSSGAELLPVSAPQRVFFDTLDRDYPQLAAPAATVVARTSLEQASTWADSEVATVPGVTRVEPRDLGGGYSAVDVHVDAPVLSGAVDRVVRDLRADRPDFPTWVTGQQAAQDDFLAGMRDRAPYAVLLVVVATFVLLFLMTGSVVIPAKALILNVMSLGASLGVLVWVFQDGHLEGLVRFDSVGAIESMIPFLVLAFGFGLSMDYEVFLLARISELYRSGVPNDRSVSLGLQRSGRIITSAALLICIVFAGFAAGQLLVIKQIGVALVTAVIIDATLVRMLLVPATMTVLGQWNWWAPAPLRRWHARFGLTE